MRAILYRSFGGPETLTLADIDEPAATPGTIVVALRASSVNGVDTRARNGELWPLVNRRFPKIPGVDVAGTVAAIGAGVTGLSLGDPVFGATNPFRGGAFAERVRIGARSVAPIPQGLSFETAAALPVTGLAALQAIRDLGQLRAGQSILVHGASGNAGLLAVQLAKRRGAHVTAVGGPAALDAMRAAGADTVFDHRAGPPAYDRRFDLILNASGRLPYRAARPLLTAHGRAVEFSPTIPSFIGSALANRLRRRQHLMLAVQPRRADLAELASAVLSGTLTLPPPHLFPLAAARDAFALAERGGTIGKVVITIPGDH